MSINEVKNVDGPEPPVEKLIPQRLISPCSKQNGVNEVEMAGTLGGGHVVWPLWPCWAAAAFCIMERLHTISLILTSCYNVPPCLQVDFFLSLVSRLLISEMCLFFCCLHTNSKCRFNQMGFKDRESSIFFKSKISHVLLFALKVDRVTAWRVNIGNPWACLAKLDSLPWATYPFAFIVSEKSQLSFRSA